MARVGVHAVVEAIAIFANDGLDGDGIPPVDLCASEGEGEREFPNVRREVRKKEEN